MDFSYICMNMNLLDSISISESTFQQYNAPLEESHLWALLSGISEVGPVTQ